MLVTMKDIEYLLPKNISSICIKEINKKFSCSLELKIEGGETKRIQISDSKCLTIKMFNSVSPWITWVKTNYPEIKKVIIILE
tara:strand:+ start:233 stop:481 length:249 start_codon:yes stop_codon:yes gene_type:complete